MVVQPLPSRTAGLHGQREGFLLERGRGVDICVNAAVDFVEESRDLGAECYKMTEGEAEPYADENTRLYERKVFEKRGG